MYGVSSCHPEQAKTQMFKNKLDTAMNVSTETYKTECKEKEEKIAAANRHKRRKETLF